MGGHAAPSGAHALVTEGVSRRRALADTAARAALVLVLTALAFVQTWARVLGDTGWGAGSPVLLAAPVGAVLTTAAILRRRRAELPIHDRQSDVIVGTVIMAIALMIQWLVLPRFEGTYVLLHLDVAAAWAFVLGGCVFMFGLRRTGHFWPAWVLLAVASPGALRLAVYYLGGEPWATAAVIVLTVAVGPVTVGITAALKTGTRQRAARPGPAVSAREARRSIPILVGVAVVLSLAPLPAVGAERLGNGPAGSFGVGQTIPQGWTERSAEDIDWAARVFGPGATLHRQLIRADEPRSDWDLLSRPRQAVVQTLTVDNAGLFDAFPIETSYDLGSARVSPPEAVDLGNGIDARYRTIVDEKRLLTWSLMSFVWERPAGRVQRVSLLTVDNHEHDAEFPQTVPGTGSTVGRLISLLLRGQGAVVADDAERKDLGLLTELGRDLVAAQWTP